MSKSWDSMPGIADSCSRGHFGLRRLTDGNGISIVMAWIMPVLLTPPERREEVRGFLWWKRRFLTFRMRILTSGQAKGAGVALFQALAKEHRNCRRIESILITVVGDVEPTFCAYESFRTEGEKDVKVSDWLAQQVPFFSLCFETLSGDLIREYIVDTEDGERTLSTMTPMGEEQAEAAKQRVEEGLREMLHRSK